MTAADTAVLVERDGGVATITFCRPAVLNALDSATAGQLCDVVQDLAADSSVRAVLLTGAGRAFSAGADLSDALTDTEQLLRQVVAPLITTLRSMPKPVVAGVNGPAAGWAVR